MAPLPRRKEAQCWQLFSFFQENLEIQLLCEIFLFFFFYILETYPLKKKQNKLFYEPSKMISARQMWPVGSQLEIANFSPMPSLQTRRLNRHPESKRTLPMVTEQVYGGAKAQTNFSNSHPPTFHNTKSWRLIIDHRKKKTGMLITPMKEHSTAGNEEIAPSGGSRGRRKGRRKASYGRD